MKLISVSDRYSLNIYEDKRIQYNQFKHLSRIAAIYRQKSNVSELEKEQERLLKNMHRSKEVNRHFKERQIKRNIQKSNTNLRKRILYQSCTKTQSADIDNYLTQFKPEKQDERINREKKEISRQNMKIRVALEQNMKSRKKYRKEAQKDIESYLSLRDRITKLKIKKQNDKNLLTSIEIPDSKGIGKKDKRFRKKIKTRASKSNINSKGNDQIRPFKQKT